MGDYKSDAYSFAGEREELPIRLQLVGCCSKIMTTIV